MRRSRCCRRAPATSSCWCPRRGGSPWRSCRGSSRARGSGRPWKPPRTADVATVGAGSVVTFTHPLLASAIYDAATPAERRRAHRVLAEKLDDPVERARHRSRTITAPDEAVARELEQAADISRGRGAQQLAGELLEAAALATPTDADTASRSGSLAPRGGHLHRRRRRPGGAERPWTRGRRWRPSRSSRPRCWCGESGWPTTLPAARSLAEQALRLAPTGSEVRAEILQILGVVHRVQGRRQACAGG